MTNENEDLFEKLKQNYMERLKPLFFPDDPISNDIVDYFCALLRTSGSEDKGWDPHEESRGILEDLNKMFSSDVSPEIFENYDLTQWRIGLLMYCHIIEMDGPYEVLLNLASYQLGEGVRPNPFFKKLNSKEKRRAKANGIAPWKKIDVLKTFSDRLDLDFGSIFDEFYSSEIRNAVNHSDYIITSEHFRSRSTTNPFKYIQIELSDVEERLVKSKAFIAAFFQLEMDAKVFWGSMSGKAVPYDPIYKGMMEILVNRDDMFCGFRVLWPNESISELSRTEKGTTALNCMVSLDPDHLQLFVGLYASNPGDFSPLVERGAEPCYAPLSSTGIIPIWDSEEIR